MIISWYNQIRFHLSVHIFKLKYIYLVGKVKYTLCKKYIFVNHIKGVSYPGLKILDICKFVEFVEHFEIFKMPYKNIASVA